MKLWDFARFSQGRIPVSRKVGDPLGLVEGSEVFSAMFRYEAEGKESFEIVLSPFGPENYRELASLTFHLRDVPGALAQCAQFLKGHNIDILNSESVSTVPGIAMIWRMIVDLSFFGDRPALNRAFSDRKKVSDPALSLVDDLDVKPCELAERFTKGAIAGQKRVRTQPLRKIEKKASLLREGAFEVPEAYAAFLGRTEAPVLEIGETESWILSLVFLPDNAALLDLRTRIPDRPGAIHEVTSALARRGLNILTGSTTVLIYYKAMACDLAVDCAGAGKSPVTLVPELTDVIAALGPEFTLLSAEPVGL